MTVNKLTQREWSVLRLVAQRLTNKKIAKRLHISLYTVKNHVHNIIDKLHATDRRDAVRIGLGITLSDETRCDECPVMAKAVFVAYELRQLAEELHKEHANERISTMGTDAAGCGSGAGCGVDATGRTDLEHQRDVRAFVGE